MAPRLVLVAVQAVAALAIRQYPPASQKGHTSQSLEAQILGMALNETVRSCDLCKDRWLVIMSSGGRTGSTTVMHMMNALDGVLVNGENWMAMKELEDYYEKMQKTGWKEVGGSWKHPSIDEKAVLCAMQSLAKTSLGPLPVGTHTLGFKEVRWGQMKSLDFVTKLLPCGKFIVNTRNFDDQFRSARNLWQQDEEGLRTSTQLLTAFQANHPEQVRPLRTEDFDPTHFNDLLPWIGVQGCRFKRVCHANDHRKGGYNDNGCGKGDVLDGSCTLIG